MPFEYLVEMFEAKESCPVKLTRIEIPDLNGKESAPTGPRAKTGEEPVHSSLHSTYWKFF